MTRSEPVSADLPGAGRRLARISDGDVVPTPFAPALTRRNRAAFMVIAVGRAASFVCFLSCSWRLQAQHRVGWAEPTGGGSTARPSGTVSSSRVTGAGHPPFRTWSHRSTAAP